MTGKDRVPVGFRPIHVDHYRPRHDKRLGCQLAGKTCRPVETRCCFSPMRENGFPDGYRRRDGQLLRRHSPKSTMQDAGRANADFVPRCMDVLVSRLKRKARSAGIYLPLPGRHVSCSIPLC